MKFVVIFASIALAAVCTRADEAETDVLRVFDPKLKLTNEEMLAIIEKAQLEKFGFEKTTESTIETDENGEKKMKKTIHYFVTSKCSKAAYWESVLEQRLPVALLESKIGSTFVREIKRRVMGRKPKFCKIGLEIHPNRCSRDTRSTGSRKKRGPRGCGWCLICLGAKIAY